ncbi:RNA polymerase sigma factor [Paenibacillus alkalitolerans]|uniref:RNA polymerase sigma factor n=1 Tax=Paenibacillus alkalitolerans TaxID=2799335 RepID=UPI0018F71B56|nr:RNA polymerase sigma factor [Paenibacillus alkalitolerans]
MNSSNKDLTAIKQIVTRYSLKIAGDKWDAEDLAQDVLVKVMRALETEPSRDITNAYLYRIAVNTWNDKCKKEKQNKRTVRDDPFMQAREDDNLSTRELLEVLAHRLSPRAMVILLLMDVFDFTAKETAGLLGSTEGAVQVTLGRVRSRLKKLAQQKLADPFFEESRPSIKTSDEEEPINFDAIVDAFRRRDPKAICRAYLGLTEQGIVISTMKLVDGKLSFYFTDPDGNMFRVTA